MCYLLHSLSLGLLYTSPPMECKTYHMCSLLLIEHQFLINAVGNVMLPYGLHH